MTPLPPDGLTLAALLLAALPWAIALPNLLRLPRPRSWPHETSLVSILIPARDEAGQIAACVTAALASQRVAVEVLVMDDASRDDTARIVRTLAPEDERLRLLTAPPLPPGWTGKVHACAHLAAAARGTHLLFIDADVRLAPQAAAALAAWSEDRDLALVSGVPQQVMRSPGEALTVPMINLLMLAYLPGGGRPAPGPRPRRPSLAAACGQLVLVQAAAYRAVGGHAAAPAILHESLALARRLRVAGFRTGIVDATALASCRMYQDLASAWAGFGRNAREGMATPLGLPVWTLLLAGGHVLPWLLVASAPWNPPALAALALSLGLRGLVAWRCREPWWVVPLLPATVLMALAIQWAALLRLTRPGWKGRALRPDMQPGGGTG